MNRNANKLPNTYFWVFPMPDKLANLRTLID